MTLTLDLAQDVVEAIAEAAARQGRSREELAAAELQRLFLPQDDIALLLDDKSPADSPTLSERGFAMAAEGTRHIWDTPEEDAAWVHL
ncbi:MAG: hypothetical protein ACRYFS_16915 [Janthinobacterium lividum]